MGLQRFFTHAVLRRPPVAGRAVIRSRWAAVGAAVAVTVGAIGGSSVPSASAVIEDPTAEKAVYVPITPCRLLDTRPTFQVGPNATPLGTTARDVTATGSAGDCSIPTTATAIAANATAIGATAPTFVVFFPAGATPPNASHLNPVPGQPPTPNAVDIDLNSNGAFTIKNAFGEVDLIVDIVGYFEDHSHADLAKKSDLDPLATKDQLDGYVTKPTSLVLDGYDWRPQTPTTNWEFIGLWDHGPSAGGECISANADLPVGAEITKVTLHYIVSSPVGLQVTLQGFPSHPGFPTPGIHLAAGTLTQFAATSQIEFGVAEIPLDPADTTVRAGSVYVVDICADADVGVGSVQIDFTSP